MATKRKCTILSIEDKITICEYLDKGSSKREITHEYDHYDHKVININFPPSKLCTIRY